MADRSNHFCDVTNFHQVAAVTSASFQSSLFIIHALICIAPSMKFYHPPRESPRAMGCHVCIHFASLLLDSYLTHVNLARGGIQKSKARVHAHFSSPHSSRRLRWFSFAFVTFDRDTLFKQVSLLPGYARSTCWCEQQRVGLLWQQILAQLLVHQTHNLSCIKFAHISRLVEGLCIS